MKKKFTIFAFLVFFLAQFGKVINYCFCSMAAYRQTSSIACDCEKQLFTGLEKETADQHRLPHTYSAQTPTEELFHLSGFSELAFLHPATAGRNPAGGQEPLYHTFGNPVFRPPLPSAFIQHSF